MKKLHFLHEWSAEANYPERAGRACRMFGGIEGGVIAYQAAILGIIGGCENRWRATRSMTGFWRNQGKVSVGRKAVIAPSRAEVNRAESGTCASTACPLQGQTRPRRSCPLRLRLRYRARPG